MRTTCLALVTSVAVLAGCGDDDDSVNSQPDAATAATPDAAANPDAAAEQPDAAAVDNPQPGVLFTLDNAVGRASVVMFARDAQGALTRIGAFPTGGRGTGAAFSAQSAVALHDTGDFLFAVSVGSNEVSSFRVFDDHLALIDVVDSGGTMPVSVAARGDRLYVLHGDGAGSVAGFHIDEGVMTPIDGATKPLSGDIGPAVPAQIAFSPDGNRLLVSEIRTAVLTGYAVAADGSLSDPVVTPSVGPSPFGFEFTSGGYAIVSEAFGGVDGAAAVSSYGMNRAGGLSPITSSLADQQTSACWIAIARDRFAYATNFGTNSVSGYQIAADGSLSLIDADGITASLGEGAEPVDMAVSANSDYLYVLQSGTDTIVGFQVGEDGSLTALPGATAVPADSQGLAGF